MQNNMSDKSKLWASIDQSAWHRWSGGGAGVNGHTGPPQRRLRNERQA